MSIRAREGVVLVVWVCLLSASSAIGMPMEHVIPRLAQTPSIDGELDDPAWALDVPSLEISDGQTGIRVGFEETGLWIAAEGLSNGATAQFAMAFRLTDCVDEQDLFLLGRDGQRQIERQRIAPISLSDNWTAATQIHTGNWNAEVHIPFGTLGIEALAGDVFEARFALLALESESALYPVAQHAVSPRFARFYLEKQNLVISPDLSDRLAWGFGEGDDVLYQSHVEGDDVSIRVQVPGRYSVIQQGLRLKPHAFYRLEAEAKGTSRVYLRARTAPKQGDKTNAYSVWTRASSEYQRHVVYFPTGETGDALIIIGSTESSPLGQVNLSNLAVVREIQYESLGPRIDLRADSSASIVKKLSVADCRALRGFVVAPVDGKLNSPRWDANVWEYNQPGAGAGVGYTHRGNDGLHITLADDAEVDLLLVHGGAQASVYTDVELPDTPGSSAVVARLLGSAQVERVSLADPKHARTFSFFEVRNGLLADISFLQVSSTEPELVRGLTGRRFFVTGPGPSSSKIQEALEARFHESEPGVFTLSTMAAAAEFSVGARETAHLVTEPFASEQALDALTFTAQVRAPGSVCPLTAILHDPLNPSVELMRADFAVHGSGRIQFTLDFPNQIIPAHGQLWLSLNFLGGAIVNDASVALHGMSRKEAQPEALAYRKLHMRGLFSALSEARPWTGFRRDTNLETWLSKQGKYASLLRELVETIDQCKWLAGTVQIDGTTQVADDLVRQYDEWFYRSHRRPLPPFEPKIDSVPGVPEWAAVLRQAWLTARSVPEWWLDHRLVPTGEFGGQVGDDTDMYQNFIDFPMLEDGPFAQRLKDAASQLMLLAEADTMEAGLNRRTMDPLHAYEEGLNQEALMLLWDYGDPVAFERCLTASRSLQSLTVRTERGHVHFKSQECGAEDLRRERPVDVDGHAHPLMLHPAFEAAWYSGNPTVLGFLRAWGESWLEHMKPGEYATSVEVATERVVATTHRPLYGGYGGLGSAMLFMHRLTSDARYIGPFMETWQRGSDNTSPHNLLPEMWHQGALAPLEQEALVRLVDGRGIAEWLVTGDKQPLIEALIRDIAEIQRFPAMYTTAEPFTDRIFLRAITNAAIATTGGYATRNKFVHSHAISWERFGTDIAALVVLARPEHLKVLVYSFAEKPLNGRMRVWTLEPGRYALRVGVDQDGNDQADSPLSQSELALQRADTVDLVLQPKRVTVLELDQIEPHAPLHPRPDLALSRHEISFVGNTLTVPVHNIGSADAPSSLVMVTDEQGNVLAEAMVPPLAAPLDLMPKTHVVTLTLSGRQATAVSVHMVASEAIPEIYDANNRVQLAELTSGRHGQ